MFNNLLTTNDDGMRNEFQIFSNDQLGSVRVQIDNQGNPWFCLSDVCDILGIQNTHRVTDRLFDPYVTSITVGVQTGLKADGTPAIQYVSMTFIDEGNLYKVIMGSRKPEAQEFQRWICYEVIPSLRKNGIAVVNNLSPIQVLKAITEQITVNANNIFNLQNDLSLTKNDVEELKKKLEEMRIRNYYDNLERR